MVTPPRIIRMPPIRVTATPAPGPGGCLIYCASDDEFFSTAVDNYLEVTLPLVLAQRATVNIQIIAGGNGTFDWYVDDPERRGDAALNDPFTDPLTTAITRDGGSWPITASLSGPTGAAIIMIVAIVGANTEDDCVHYRYGT